MDTGTGSTKVKQASFFSRVTAELKKLFTHVPGWEASAAATLTYIAPLVEVVLALVEPEAVPAVVTLVAKIQSAMAAAAVVVKDAGPAPTLVTYLNAIKADLTQVEAAAQIKDASSVAKLNAAVTTIAAEVDAILAVVKPAQA